MLWGEFAVCAANLHGSTAGKSQCESLQFLHFSSKKSINIFLPLANSYADREKLQVIRTCCSPIQFHIKSLLHRLQNMNTSCLGRNASFQIQAGSLTKAGIASNLQEKPSGDTKTDLFLCLLQHICLGWDSGPPLSDQRQQAACAPEGFYICVRLTLTPEVPVSYPVLMALSASCTLISSTHRGHKQSYKRLWSLRIC